MTAEDVLADVVNLGDMAKKLLVTRPPKKARQKEQPFTGTYSDHMAHDLRSAMLNFLAARKILYDPSRIYAARRLLERWISKQHPVPQALREWRTILEGTPQDIAAVAMGLTEESTRLRSSSPLGCLLTKQERVEVYAFFAKTHVQARTVPARSRRIIEQATAILGSAEAANTWIKSPQFGLAWKRPLDLLATTQGTELVKTLLVRMKFGVYT
jgi:hypothetical protein